MTGGITYRDGLPVAYRGGQGDGAEPEAAPSLDGVIADLERVRGSLQEAIDAETAAFEARIQGKVAELRRAEAALGHLRGSAGGPRRRRDAGRPRGGKTIDAVLAFLRERRGDQVPSGVIAQAVIESGATTSPGSAKGAIKRLAEEGRIGSRSIDGNRKVYWHLPEDSE